MNIFQWLFGHEHSPSDADRACNDAREGLQEARARWPEVMRVTKSLRDLREHNHFAENIAATFREGPA